MGWKKKTTKQIVRLALIKSPVLAWFLCLDNLGMFSFVATA